MNHHTCDVHDFLNNRPDEQANSLSTMEVVGYLEFLFPYSLNLYFVCNNL